MNSEFNNQPSSILTPPPTKLSRLKLIADLNWDLEDERSLALSKVLEALEAVENWVAQQEQTQAKIPDSAHQNLKVARQIEAQDVETSAEGKPKIRRGVAKNRRKAC